MLYTDEVMERERVHRLLQPDYPAPAWIIRREIPLFPSFPKPGAVETNCTKLEMRPLEYTRYPGPNRKKAAIKLRVPKYVSDELGGTYVIAALFFHLEGVK